LTNSRDNTLKLIDSRTYEVVSTIEDNLNYTCPRGICKIALSQSGDKAILPSASGHLVAFDLTNGKFLKALKNDKLKGLPKNSQ